MTHRILVAAALLGGCALSPAPAEREPPLPQMMLDFALAAPGNDGGTRAQFLAMLGREDLFEQPARQTCAPLQRDGAPVDPVSEIARQATGQRVVIINEAHERPQHRAFIADVATRLRRDGFEIYAAETFLERVREQRGWPNVNDGAYSREPAFGALLRRARGLGFRFYQYEDFSPPQEGASQREQIARREALQAANLQRILEQNPDARVLIHVGHAHLLEQPDGNGNVWMAQRLKEATGIDPLTIDQTRYASNNEAYVFCDPAQTQSPNIDIRIGSPNLTFEDGRPAWRQHAGQRTVAVPPSLINAAQTTIIEVRFANEPDDAVPADRLLLRPGEALPLLLAPGGYRVESWRQDSGWSAPVEIDVD